MKKTLSRRDIHGRFTATQTIPLIRGNKASYKPGQLQLDPRHRRPDCSEATYQSAMAEGLLAAKAGRPRDACPYDAAQDRRADAWLHGWSPSLVGNDVQALNGRLFTSLTPSELEQLNYFRKRGRKWGIAIGFGTSTLDPLELLRALRSKRPMTFYGGPRRW